MALLTCEGNKTALERLGQLAEAHGQTVRLIAVGGAVMALVYEARQATRDVDVLIQSPRESRLVRELAGRGHREQVWEQVRPYLVPGAELKAQYAFHDLWESLHGNA